MNSDVPAFLPAPVAEAPQPALVEESSETFTADCDACHVKVEVRLQEVRHEDGRIEQGFICPNCGKGYPTAVLTSKAVRYRDELRRMRADINERRAAGERVGMPRRYFKVLGRYQRALRGE